MEEHHVRHQERVPEHRGLGDAGRPGPSLLESQLSDEVYEVERVSGREDLAHSDEIDVLLDLPVNLLPGPVYAVEGAVGIVDKTELPPGGEVVGGADYRILLGVLGGVEVLRHPIDEARIAVRDEAQELLHHESVDLPAALGGYAVEHLGLEIGENGSLDEREQGAFHHGPPVHRVACGFLELPEDPSYGRLVGLLVELREIDGPHMVVPPVHIGGIEQQVEHIGVEDGHLASSGDR